jgi:hypothetical protein
LFRCLSRFSFGPPAKARNSLCRAWDNLPDLVEIDVDDGDEFSVSVSGTSNPGESCFVDLWVNSTRAGRGYRFYFGPSTTLIFGPDIDTFTEKGAGRFNLIIAEQNLDSLIGEIG